MRAALARLLRTVADCLSVAPEVDGLRLRVRALEVDVAFHRRRAESEFRACERYIAERDSLALQLDAMRAEAVSWLRIAGDASEALILKGATRGHLAPAPSPDRVVVPFGRRRPPE